MNQQQTIRVVNNSKRVLRGRFDGIDYQFAPKRPVDLPLDAATHIFGLGEEDKAPALNRLGFLTPGRDTLEDAIQRLDEITFFEGRVVFDTDEPESAAPGGELVAVTGRAKATPGRRPHVDRGGELGGGLPPPGDPQEQPPGM